jgi:hypothetical protein
VALSVLAVSVAAGAVELPPPVPNASIGEGQLLTDWVSHLAGTTALSCHANRFSLDQAEPLACAQRAIADSKPFWISFEEIGLDYGGWRGFVRNAEGQMWMVTYDFGSSMKNMERPHVVSVVTCERLYVEGTQVRCDEL